MNCGRSGWFQRSGWTRTWGLCLAELSVATTLFAAAPTESAVQGESRTREAGSSATASKDAGLKEAGSSEAGTREAASSAVPEAIGAEPLESADRSAPAPRERRASLSPQVTTINEQLDALWKSNQLNPSAPASDSEYCRRLFLDVLGRIPTVEELQAYVNDRKPDRKTRLVQRLLHDEAYTIDFARHWSTIWTNLLIGRQSADDDNDNLVDRTGMEKYLRDAFAENLPYDRLVYQLVSAEGTNRPGSPQFNGAVNFLTAKLNDRATQATAQTARLFLGMQVQCTQCHNHPFNEAKQNQFWQLNAFFRQTTTLRRFAPGTDDVQYVELTDQDFGGEDSPNDPENARIYYELRNGKLEAAFPVFIDGTSIETSGFIQDVKRRGELAALISSSPYLSRAIVNRLWAHFLGYGFTRPIDDMGPHNRPVMPELLDYLAEELEKNSYDLKQLISWIVLSDAYGLSSATTKANRSDDPALGQPPAFTHFYVRQMTAEQLYQSLLVASEADKTHGSQQQQQDAQREWLKQFTIAFGTDEGDETTTFDGTITQTLMMFNGELMERATSGDEGSFLSRIARDDRQKPAAKVQQLYLAALARKANQQEQRMFLELLAYHKQDELKALQDLWWALLNSNQFILNY